MEGKSLVFWTLAIQIASFVNGESFVCPNDGIFANPDDCSTYYSCTGLIPTLMPCPPTMLFDPVTKICNVPEKVTCHATSTSSSTTSTSTQRPQTSTTGRPSDVNCPESGVQLVPNPEDCTSFYVCIEGRSEIENCPEGYGFNQLEQRCTSDVNDCDANGPQTTTPSPDKPTCPSSAHQRLPNPKDCNSFYVCLEGFAYLITCPVNYQFNDKVDLCQEAASSQCGDFVTPNPIDQECSEHPDGYLLANASDCSKFFQCSHGKAMPQTCPNGLYFSVSQQSCVKPAMSECKSS